MRYLWRVWLGPQALKRIWREEILCAYRSAIPVCCIGWYLLTVYLCLLIRHDSKIILPLMFGQDGWEEFNRLQYYRCPCCRFRRREVEIIWWTS